MSNKMHKFCIIMLGICVAIFFGGLITYLTGGEVQVEGQKLAGIILMGCSGAIGTVANAIIKYNMLKDNEE